jgi:hypothetical protein
MPRKVQEKFNIDTRKSTLEISVFTQVTNASGHITFIATMPKREHMLFVNDVVFISSMHPPDERLS